MSDGSRLLTFTHSSRRNGRYRLACSSYTGAADASGVIVNAGFHRRADQLFNPWPLSAAGVQRKQAIHFAVI
jgi:hypothetical protein